MVISRGGVMFFADPAAAFRNLVRALMPGGRPAFVCPRPTGVGIAPVTVETVWGEDAADAVGFVLSRTPGRTVPAGTRAALEESLRPYETPHGVRLRGGLWLVAANRAPDTRRR